MSRSTWHTSIPVRIKDTDGNLVQGELAALSHGTYLGALQLVADYAAGVRYNGALSSSSTTSTAIGTFTNTNNAAAVNQPATTITSTATSLYQLDDALPTLGDNCLLGCDSDGQLYQFNDGEQAQTGGLLAFAHGLQYPGITFKLGSTTPTPTVDYEIYESNVFQNTINSAATTTYNIYRRKSLNTGFTIGYDDTNGMGVCKTTISGKFAVKQATDAQVGKTFARALMRAKAATGLGRYLLLPSTTTPAGEGESGTWVARGTATDTRKGLSNVFFVGQGADQQWIGQRGFTGWAGVRQATQTFIGNRTTPPGQTGDVQFVNGQGQKFAGTRDFVGNRDAFFQDFVGGRNATFVGKRDTNYAGVAVNNTTQTIETYTLYVRTN